MQEKGPLPGAKKCSWKSNRDELALAHEIRYSCVCFVQRNKIP